MKLTVKIWRQKKASAPGRFVGYHVDGVTADMSFLEMLDVLNEQLIERGEEPVGVRARLPRAGHRDGATALAGRHSRAPSPAPQFAHVLARRGADGSFRVRAKLTASVT